MNIDQSGFKTMRNVLLAGVVLLVIKFTAFFITHSNAILSDALESIINVAAGAFTLFSIALAAKPKDINHPYGHGKIEFVAAGFEGGLILLAGLLIITKAIYNFIHPSELHSLGTGTLLAGVSGFANYILGYWLIREGEKIKSVALVADGKHLQSDTWSSAGLVAGMLMVWLTGYVWLDNVFAILFAVFIIITGYKLVRKSLAGLMDEADENIMSEVLEVLNKHRSPKWIDIHNLRMQQYGSSFYIDCHITLPWYNNLHDTHDELKKIEYIITSQFHHQVELFIHPDPCIPESCSLCQITECKHRIHPFKEELKWTLKNVMENKKHMS
jgi:cation diffusion facilitator family transporter